MPLSPFSRDGGGFEEWPQSPGVVSGGGNNEGNGYANPGGTLPLPTPDLTKRPVGYYEKGPDALSWSFGTGQITRTASWKSALLNLRTDLRGVSSREPGGFPLNRTYAAQMFIAVRGLASAHLGLEVYKADYGHPFDPRPLQATQFTAFVNVTADLATMTDMAILDYWAPGSGYNMQYWGVMLRFDFVSKTPAALPNITVAGAAY